MNRRLRVVGIAIVAGAALPAPAGHAVTASGYTSLCAGSITWEFSPPLTQRAGTGTVTQTFSGVCGLLAGGVDTGTVPPAAGEYHSLFGFGPATVTGGYSGDCRFASVSIEGTQYLLLNSTVAVDQSLSLTGSAQLGTALMTPDQQCNTSSASGDRVVSGSAAGLS